MSTMEPGVDYQIREQMIELMPRLQRFTYSLTGSRADAEDLLQATYVRAIENLDKWVVGSRLDSWMYRMAQNIHKNNLRHGSVKAGHQQVEMAAENRNVDGVGEAIHKDALKRVSVSIDRLPDEQRTVLLLVAVEGYGYKEAAAILEVPIGTVTSRLARARQALGQDVYGREQ